MKLGRDTVSMTNYLMSGTKGQPVPEVGMGVTILMWTDRYAGTITRVSPSGKTFWYREDKATCTGNGMNESQTWTHEPDPNAPEHAARLSKRGEWHRSPGSTRLALGYRNTYRDPSF
jgi:hypothetical protein